MKEIYQIYQELLNQRLIKNYHELINSFASEIINENSKDIFSVDEDTAEMIEHMMGEAGIDEGEVVLIETKPPTTYSKTGATEQRKKLKKIDFELKNKEDITTGFISEKLVVHKEKSDLIKRGKPELAKKVRWVSQDQDGLGFDVLSFNEDGSEKYIEVKTTTLSNVNQPFNISKNEILTSEKKNENFWIYRVYELKSDKPKFYKIQGPVEENFILEATSFLAFKK